MLRLVITTAACLILSGSLAQDYKPLSLNDSISKPRVVAVASVGVSIYATGLSYLSFVWYKDHERTPFHLYNDSKGYLQMDKLGHAYAAYWESAMAYKALRWAGLDRKKAIIWGGPVGFLFQAPIEIFDGLYQGWGFSWWDIAANGFGSSLFSVQQALLNKQVITMKFSYSPSGYPKYHHILGETEIESFFLDYNGHTYWLSANLKSITGIQGVPSWLNVAVGYSANGMIKEFENPTYYKGKPFPHLERYRQFIFSLDMDLTKIQTKRRWVRSILNAVNVIKVPFPAIEVNRVEGIRFWPVYF